MMLLGWLGLGAAFFSAVCVAILARLDRRRRNGITVRPRIRRLLLLAMLMPGLVLGFAGRWSDFLIWIGAAAILGWAIAALASMRGNRDQPS
jgi:ABC-type Fe3+ transport system permease subunit